jgi:enolase
MSRITNVDAIEILARSGEADDTTIADFAVATGSRTN